MQLDQLLSSFNSKPGNNFNPQQHGTSSGQFDKLAEFASEASGGKIPAPALKALINWKLNGKI